MTCFPFLVNEYSDNSNWCSCLSNKNENRGFKDQFFFPLKIRVMIDHNDFPMINPDPIDLSGS